MENWEKWVIVGLIVYFIIAAGIVFVFWKPITEKLNSGSDIIDSSSNLTSVPINNTSIGINLLTKVSLYGYTYTVQANSTQNTPILQNDSIQIFSPGKNRLIVEYQGANLFPQLTFVNHINKQFRLPDMNGTDITVYLYSYQQNTTYTKVYSINVMTISTYRTYVTNHLTPQSALYPQYALTLSDQIIIVVILATIGVFIPTWYWYFSSKSEREGDTSLFER